MEKVTQLLEQYKIKKSENFDKLLRAAASKERATIRLANLQSAPKEERDAIHKEDVKNNKSIIESCTSLENSYSCYNVIYNDIIRDLENALKA